MYKRQIYYFVNFLIGNNADLGFNSMISQPSVNVIFLLVTVVTVSYTHLVHMADTEGLEECIKAKTEGHEIYIETCPQYIEFTCDVYKREDGRNFVCSPPMKGKESQDALWTALKAGPVSYTHLDVYKRQVLTYVDNELI